MIRLWSAVQSNSDFIIVRFEVEFLTLRTKNARVLLIVGVHILLKGSLSWRSSQIIRESLSIPGDFKLLVSVETRVSLVEEVSVPGFASQHTIVQKKFQNDELGKDSSSSSRGHIRPIVVVNMVPPFNLKSFEIGITLSSSLRPDMLWNEKSSAGSFNLEISFSPSGFENPVVWMETILWLFNTFLWRCVRRGCIFSITNHDEGTYPQKWVPVGEANLDWNSFRFYRKALWMDQWSFLTKNW